MTGKINAGLFDDLFFNVTVDNISVVCQKSLKEKHHLHSIYMYQVF